MKLILSIAESLTVAPCYLIYLWAADQFCKKYLEITKKKELLFAVILFGGWMILEILNQHYFIPYVVSAFLSHVILMGSVLLLFRGEIEKKILTASILITVKSLTADFCGSLFSCLALIWLHTAGQVAVPFIGGWESVLIAWASFMIVILALHGIARHLVSVLDDKPGKWYVVLTVPLFVITMIDNVAGWGASNGIMVRSGGNMGLYYDQIFSHTEFCVLTALSMFTAGFYVFGMNRIYLEQEKSSQYHAKIAAYQMLTEQYSQSERLRHDMKNHIIALSGLFQSREWDKMGDYLKNMEAGSLEKGADLTGNQAVDALLYQKRKRAEKEHIKWECEVQIPKVCGIHEFDLCVLFGNLLDNALEACKRLQCSELCGECCFVNVQAKMIKKCFLLEVKNSMDRMETYKGGCMMNAKTMEGLAGAGTNMNLLQTPMRVYKEARRRGNMSVMERAMGYVGEFAEKAEEYKAQADKGMEEDAKEAREKARAEQEKAVRRRKEEREKLEERLEENRNADADTVIDTVEFSEEGKKLSGDNIAFDCTDSGEAVTYTKTGEIKHTEQRADISVSV